jgi:protein gp37
MSENSKIQWTDDTMNFWQGCTKISPGCQFCYAEARDQRFSGGTHWGPGAPRARSKDFDAPLRWNEKPWVCETCGKIVALTIAEHNCQNPQYHRRRVFSLSLGDWLDDEVPIEWLADMLDVIRRCPNLDFLLLTKRPENWNLRAEAVIDCEIDKGREMRVEVIDMLNAWLSGTPPANVWIGTTVENQEYADKRIRELLKIPAVCRFLSVEPMLGPIEFSDVTNRSDAVEQWGKKALAGISWVICGGESGSKARGFDVGWARSTVAQCKAAGVACFVKQLGARPQIIAGEESIDYICRVSYRKDETIRLGQLHTLALSDKKGGDMSEWPADLRVREFPNLGFNVANE